MTGRGGEGKISECVLFGCEDSEFGEENIGVEVLDEEEKGEEEVEEL